MDQEFKNFDFLKSNYEINLFGGTEVNSNIDSPRMSESPKKGKSGEKQAPKTLTTTSHTDSKVTVLPRQ